MREPSLLVRQEPELEHLRLEARVWNPLGDALLAPYAHELRGAFPDGFHHRRQTPRAVKSNLCRLCNSSPLAAHRAMRARRRSVQRSSQSRHSIRP